MAEIIKTYREEVPEMRFIGKKYTDFGNWGEWFANGWFDEIERAMGGVDSILAIWASGGGYVGLEMRGENEFEYYIGMFTPAGTTVPDGFDYIDIPACAIGTCWIYGKEGGDTHQTGGCRPALERAGMRVWHDARGRVWSFENGLCPRYTTPDEHGNVILDYSYFVE